MTPLVSIIIITYNYEQFICDAINSALGQDYPNTEILVVDDGSTDKTAKLINEKYGDKIKYVYRENGGLSAARNTGIKLSRGSYLCFLDSDDILLPNFIYGHVSFLEDMTDIDILCANSEYFGQLKGPVRPKIFGKGDRSITYKDLIRDNLIPGINTVVLRRHVFDKCGYFDESVSHSEDHEFWLRCARKVHIYYCDIIVARYRIHGRNHCMMDQMMSINIETILHRQLSLNLDKQEKQIVNAQLTYNAIREAWKRGEGHEARRLIKIYRSYKGFERDRVWHFYVASFFPFKLIMGGRRVLGDIGLLTPLTKNESINKRILP